MSFCRICLNPDTPKTVDLDATLGAFYDELLYYDVIQHSALSVCTYCEHLLRKAYNFRQRCRRAHILLKLWSKDTGKEVDLNFLWQLLPKNPITIVNNHTVQNVFEYIALETGAETTDNDGYVPLVPIHSQQEQKKNKTYYQESSDAGLKDDNNTNGFENIANDFENADPSRASDNDSDDVFTDNFDDFFKSEVELNKKKSKTKTDGKEMTREKRKERRLNKRRAISRSFLEKYIADGLLKDLELDDETMLKWFDRLPMSMLEKKGLLNPKKVVLLDKWRAFFRCLKRRYDPKYEDVFDIEFLETREQKVAEFVARQHSKQFINATYKCFICFKATSQQGLFAYHQKMSHDESLPLKCDICQCGFKTKKQLKTHLNLVHEIVYHCKRCPYVTRDRGLMTFHYNEHVKTGIFCKVCGKKFRTTKTMHQHLLCHKRGACCPFCARCYATNGLRSHMRGKHENDPRFKVAPLLACPECDYAFHYADALTIHIQRDHREYRCSCGKVFHDNMSLATHTKETKHVRTISKTKTDLSCVRCDVCAMDVPYTSRFALRSHYRTAHPTLSYMTRDKQKAVVLCEHCGVACELGQKYEDHLKTHSREKPYECNECAARFETRALVEIHLKIHTENEEKVMKNAGIKYKCNMCGKEFAQRYHLRQHIKVHEDFNHEIVTSRVVLLKSK